MNSQLPWSTWLDIKENTTYLLDAVGNRIAKFNNAQDADKVIELFNGIDEEKLQLESELAECEKSLERSESKVEELETELAELEQKLDETKALLNQ